MIRFVDLDCPYSRVVPGVSCEMPANHLLPFRPIAKVPRRTVDCHQPTTGTDAFNQRLLLIGGDLPVRGVVEHNPVIFREILEGQKVVTVVDGRLKCAGPFAHQFNRTIGQRDGRMIEPVGPIENQQLARLFLEAGRCLFRQHLLHFSKVRVGRSLRVV